MHRIKLAFCVLALAPGLGWAASPSQPAGDPQLSTGGSERMPGPTFVGLTPDQTTAKQMIGAEINPASRGKPIGEIVDLLVGRESGEVDLLVLKTEGRARPAIAWESVELVLDPAPQLVTDVPLQQLQQGVQPGADADRVVDVVNDLLKRDVVSDDKQTVGKARDLVLDRASGRIDGLIVETDPPGQQIHDTRKVIAWNQIRVPTAVGAPLETALTAEQVQGLPQFGHKAPEQPARPPS